MHQIKDIGIGFGEKSPFDSQAELAALPKPGTPEYEMFEGYLDGFDLDNPEPSANRSASYRHGFANARDDRAHKPRASAADLRKMADEAIESDRATIFALPPRSD